MGFLNNYHLIHFSWSYPYIYPSHKYHWLVLAHQLHVTSVGDNAVVYHNLLNTRPVTYRLSSGQTNVLRLSIIKSRIVDQIYVNFICYS